MKNPLRSLAFVSLIVAAFAMSAANAAESTTIEWRSWSDDLFGVAQKEHRFVLLDLEAVWCHWCHVMDEVTYHDPKVIALIKARYLPVKVDQDARPDISNRYEEY